MTEALAATPITPAALATLRAAADAALDAVRPALAELGALQDARKAGVAVDRGAYDAASDLAFAACAEASRTKHAFQDLRFELTYTFTPNEDATP